MTLSFLIAHSLVSCQPLGFQVNDNYTLTLEIEYPSTAQARTIAAVTETSTGEDFCVELREQMTPPSQTKTAWNDTGDYGLNWTGGFTPLRYNYLNFTENNYLNFTETAPQFTLQAGLKAVTTFTLKSTSGIGGYYRADPAPDTTKIFRRLFSTDLDLLYNTDIITPPPTGPGG